MCQSRATLVTLTERADNLGEVLKLYTTYKKIQNKVNIYELGKLVVEFCVFCIEYSFSGNKKDSVDLVGKVLRYVDENFMEPLKIIDIAEHFFVNPAYLGQQAMRC